jgi:hypothetical protein
VSNTVYDNNLSHNVDVVDDDELNDDSIQHGIDDDPNNDARKGANLGGIGGAVTGAVAGSMVGPLGTIAGAIIGGVAGYVASGAAVGAVDNIDNDNNVSGVGTGVARDIDEDDNYTTDTTYPAGNYATTTPAYVDPYATTDANRYGTTGTVGNGVPGVQTGGHDIDGGPDTRGIGEKFADTITGDNIDDKTGEPVLHDTGRNDANTIGNDVRGDMNNARYDVENAAFNTRAAANSGIGTGFSRETEVGENLPSIKTGGVANDGTPDTRGIGEKAVDAITGDDVDDKTGRVVDHS